MRVRFDLDFDGYPWPGPLADRDSVVGETWTGPHGLLGILEVQLGLASPGMPNALRAAALVPQLRQVDGFWSQSAEVDPLATARTLLAWRDALWADGWRGQPLAPRLEQLARVTAAVAPGLPDRLDRVVQTLARQDVDLETLELADSRALYPAEWQRVFDALAAKRVKVVEVTVPDATQSGDLAACRHPKFVPQADGTLQLLRCQGAYAAADEVAAWLATLPSLEGTVILSPEPVLDHALGRHGLPTTGACADARADNALLEILPLVLALGWSPPDPERALELLTLPVSPIPRVIARRLTSALTTWPAVDSDDWRAALAEGLGKIEEPEARQRTAQRLDSLLKATVRGGQYPAAELGRRLHALETWMRGRLGSLEEEIEEGAATREHWEAALCQCANFRRLLVLTGLPHLNRSQLQRMVEEATAEVPSMPRQAAQAGLACVKASGAIGGPARNIVWWNFTRGSALAPAVIPLLACERAALADAGIRLCDPVQAAVGLNRRWERPLRFAAEHLILVCPRYGTDNEPEHPHPLWDQIIANAGGTTAAAPLLADRPVFIRPPIVRQHTLLAQPRPHGVWSVPRGRTIPSRERESPSGAGALVGCPFQWTLRYAGRITGQYATTLLRGEQLLGSTAHQILARVVSALPASPAAAETMAGELFDAEAPRLAASLFMPGQERLRAEARRITMRSAKVLVELLQAAHLGVLQVETPVRRDALETQMEGIPDLLAGPPVVVIDLKLSGERYRIEQLQSGAAYQLAAYAYLAQRGLSGPATSHWCPDDAFPPVAFFILRSQRMITTHRGLFPGVRPVEGPPPDQVWCALEKAYRQRRQQLVDGPINAPGERDEKGELRAADSGIVDDVLVLPPPCAFCDFGLLCGFGLSGR